jgi:EpsI family protein
MKIDTQTNKPLHRHVHDRMLREAVVKDDKLTLHRVLSPVRLLCLIAALVLLCYWPVLEGLVSEWVHDDDMGHGFLVPVAVGWVVWQQRKRLAVMRPSAWGLVLVLAGAALQFLGAINLGLFVGALGLICTVVGIVVAAGGLAWLRALAFPLLLLLFILPKPDFAWNHIALPLQLLASQLASAIARLAGTSVLREGNVLQVAGHRIAVEEACNGIRYLLSLGFVALLWGHVAGLRGWKRLLMGVCAIPVAILVNALRVAGVAVMCRYNYPLAIGAFHDWSGWAALVVALVLIGATERVIRRLPAAGVEPEPSPSAAAFRPAWLASVAAILLAQLVPVRVAPLVERWPQLPPLSGFPANVGAWCLTRAEPLTLDDLASVNADDVLARYYAQPASGLGEIELRVAYHCSQRVHGRLPHAPRVCLPANGWRPLESRIVPVPGGEVNLYVASKGSVRATLLYWYQTPWQITASEWRTRGWVAVNGMVHRRTDVALVRLVVPETGDRGEALDAALRFAALVMAEMHAHLR